NTNYDPFSQKKVTRKKFTFILCKSILISFIRKLMSNTSYKGFEEFMINTDHVAITNLAKGWTYHGNQPFYAEF
ncbi:MAG TPA: hypothetical protein PKN77_06075, partial [Caldisericia bacterium]|nr:hypothetical protein [Caldisericia bacterium]